MEDLESLVVKVEKGIVICLGDIVKVILVKSYDIYCVSVNGCEVVVVVINVVLSVNLINIVKDVFEMLFEL